MTLEQFEHRVSYWQRMLSPLGLSQWKVHVKIGEASDVDEYAASVEMSKHYDTAWIEITEDALAKEPGELDTIIIHELLHILFRDLDEASAPSYVVNALGSGSYSLWSDGVEHAREAVLEKLARTIYRAYNP